MNAIDLVLLALIGVSGLLGLLRGLIGVLASLAAWILAGWVAFHYGGQVAIRLAGGDTPEAGELFAGYVLCFIVVIVVVGLVAWAVRKLVGAVGLSGVDRVMGLAVGLLRGAFVGCVLVLLGAFTTVTQGEAWQASRVVPVLLPGAQWMRQWLPGWAADEVDFGRGEPDLAVPGSAPALPEPAGARAPRSI